MKRVAATKKQNIEVSDVDEVPEPEPTLSPRIESAKKTVNFSSDIIDVTISTEEIKRRYEKRSPRGQGPVTRYYRDPKNVAGGKKDQVVAFEH